VKLLVMPKLVVTMACVCTPGGGLGGCGGLGGGGFGKGGLGGGLGGGGAFSTHVEPLLV
jgi:hypothetical protein